MNALQLFGMIAERDRALDDIDPYLPKTLASLSSKGKVQFKDGSVLTKDDTLNRHHGTYEVAHEDWIVRFEYPNGEEFFFKVPVYYNSWDDGTPDEWEYDGAIVQMRKIPVTSYKWEEA